MSKRPANSLGLQHAEVVFLMPREKFTKRFIEFIDENFDAAKIAFVLYGAPLVGYEQVDAMNAAYIGHIRDIPSNGSLMRLLCGAQLIVVNWADLKILLTLRVFWKKIEIVFWGGDFYPYVQGSAPTGIMESLKWRFKRRLLCQAVACAHGIATLLPGDLAEIEKLAPQHAPWHLVAMCGTTDASFDDEERAVTEGRAQVAAIQDRPTRILVGNSATPTNRHIPVLEQLVRFADENIEVYVPLSYGDEAYRAEVIQAGSSLLGDRFRPLIDFMDMTDYKRFLATMDVGVFNHNRQQGMGNINMLLRFGAKVYISRESVMWQDFKGQGLQVFATEDIQDYDFPRFIAYDPAMAQKNAEVRDLRRARDRAVAQWEEVLGVESIAR